MQTRVKEIVDVVGTLIESPQNALALPNAPAALALKETVAEQLTANPTYAPLWEQFQANPQAQKPIIVGTLQVILQDNSALAANLETLLAQYEKHSGKTESYHAEGGMFFGEVKVKGDFAGRDMEKTIYNQGGDPQIFALAFNEIYSQIAQKPELPPQEKADIKGELEEVETELKKGAAASESFIERRLRNIGRMAPDILDVVLTTFANPILGLGMVATKIANKMKAEADPAAG